MELGIGNWLLAFLPVLLLLGGILFLRWEAAKAGAAAWFVSLAVAWGMMCVNPKPVTTLIGLAGIAFIITIQIIGIRKEKASVVISN